jgi:AbrB family looped-hinge helix DNA binding protein
MVDIISIDKAGRLVIPKSIRRSLGITEETKFIIAQGEAGRLMLQKLDIDEIAVKLEREMKGKNADAIAKRIRKDINAKIKKKYPDVFA